MLKRPLSIRFEKSTSDKMPWQEARGVYESDGPKEPMCIRFEDDDLVRPVTIIVLPTHNRGVHTGRRTYAVYCWNCMEVLHAQTTGPRFYIRRHLDEKHRRKKEDDEKC